MATVTLRNLGGSVVMTVPRKILDLIHLDAGTQVDVNVERGKLVVEPKTKPRYSLNELLARCHEKDFALARNTKFVETLPDYIVDDVLARVRALLD